MYEWCITTLYLDSPVTDEENECSKIIDILTGFRTGCLPHNVRLVTAMLSCIFQNVVRGPVDGYVEYNMVLDLR